MDSEHVVQAVFFALLLVVFAYLALLIVKPFGTYLLAVFLLAFLLWPLQQRLADRIGPRLSAAVLIVGAVAGICLVGVLLSVTLPTNSAELSAALDRVLTEIRVERRIERLLGVSVPVEATLADLPERVVDLVLGDLSNIVGAATDLFLGLVLLMFVLYYLLTDGDRLVAWLRETLPLPPETRDELISEVYVTTWAVLKGHVFVAVIQGVVAGVGLAVVGLPHVVFWTVVMMLLELVPIVGVAAVVGPAVVYLGFTGRYLAAGFLLIYGLTAVAFVDDYLRAYIVDQGSSMHSATILVGVFGGVYAFGVMGLFYGPIVLGLFQTLIRLFNETYADGAN